jgi:uncharacterized protein (TIRG00374 family)
LERFLDGRVRVTKFLTRWGLPLAVLALLIWLAARQLDPARIAAALGAAQWPAVALAALVAATLCMGGLILRLYTLLQALPHATPVGRAELASIHFASSAAHNVLPAPAGEVLRTVQLKRRNGYDIGVLVAAQLIEKLVEMLGLGLGMLAMAALGGLRGAVGASMYVLAAVSVGGAAAALVVGWRWRPTDAPYLRTDGLSRSAALRAHAANFFRRLGEGMHQLRSPLVWLRALGWSMLSDAANAATVGLCLLALGISLPVAAWFLVMLAARGAGVVPSTPGQFGVQEAAVVGALALAGLDGNRAVAVALLHHMTHFIPVTAIGLFELRRQWVPKQVETES